MKRLDWIQGYHNSHEEYFRKPFGAVECKTKINIKMEVISPSENMQVTMVISDGEKENNVPMKHIDRQGNKNIFESIYSAPGKPCLVWYYFLIHKEQEIVYYGNNVKRLGGKGEFKKDIPPGFQITVYRPYKVPDWYKESVMYQIYVDRFYKGRYNPPEGAYGRGSVLHANWDDPPFYIKDEKECIVEWDFFGGNLQGVLEKLPYFHNLGISSIYFNPIFLAASNHKYDTADYKKIDPAYGDDKILEKLTKQGEKLGIRFILDGVFSHTGSDSIYFNKEGNYDSLGAYQSQDSPYYRWYRFLNYPEEYESWWGIDVHPNVNELEPSYLDFIIRDEDSVLHHWLKKGIKGWRLDVADELPDAFIKELRAAMKKEDPSSVLIGEVWEDASNKISYDMRRQFLLGEELDSTMNYPFRDIFLHFLLGNISGEEAGARVMSLYENYPSESFYGAMNLIGSHDRTRILTLLGGAPSETELSTVDQRKYRLPKAKLELAMKRLKILSLLQFTFPGVPCIYYGDEVGVEGYSDPNNRKTYPWGRENNLILEWYKKIIKLRNTYDPLKKGVFIPGTVGEEVYSFWRIYKNQKIFCAVNRSRNKTNKIKVDDINKLKILDLLEGRNIIGDEDIELLPLQGKVFLLNN